jgi:hypothetical protein
MGDAVPNLDCSAELCPFVGANVEFCLSGKHFIDSPGGEAEIVSQSQVLGLCAWIAITVQIKCLFSQNSILCE